MSTVFDMVSSLHPTSFSLIFYAGLALTVYIVACGEISVHTYVVYGTSTHTYVHACIFSAQIKTEVVTCTYV